MKALRKNQAIHLNINIRREMEEPKTLKKKRPKIMKRKMKRKMMRWQITEIM